MDRNDWDEVWGGEHPDHKHEDNPHHGAGPEPLLKELVTGAPVGRALDLGCGLGANSIWLAEHGWQATAVDFSGVALAEGKKAAEAVGAQVRFVEADLTTYEPVGQFDLITLFYVHVDRETERQVLQRVAGALAPNGRVLFVGHDRSDPQFRERIDEDLLSTVEEVSEALAGLAIERAEVAELDAHGHGTAAATVVVARRVA